MSADNRSCRLCAAHGYGRITGVAACARRTVDSPSRGLSSRRSKPPTCVTCGYLPPLNSCNIRTELKMRCKEKPCTAFLVRITGVAPLAARPGEQRVSAVQFACQNLIFISPHANRSLSLAPPPSTPVMLQIHIPIKKRQVTPCLFFIGADNRS